MGAEHDAFIRIVYFLRFEVEMKKSVKHVQNRIFAKIAKCRGAKRAGCCCLRQRADDDDKLLARDEVAPVPAGNVVEEEEVTVDPITQESV